MHHVLRLSSGRTMADPIDIAITTIFIVRKAIITSDIADRDLGEPFIQIQPLILLIFQLRSSFLLSNQMHYHEDL